MGQPFGQKSWEEMAQVSESAQPAVVAEATAEVTAEATEKTEEKGDK